MKYELLTAETILDDYVFEYLQEIKEPERTKTELKLTKRAKALGVKVEFETLLSTHKKIEKEVKKSELQNQVVTTNKTNNVTNFNAEKYNDLVCGSWECDITGVRSYSYFGEMVACYHPIMPVKRLINIESGKEKMVIAFNKDGYWKEQIFDKSTILSANKIISSMVDYGILLSSENAKYLVKFFCDIESLNIKNIPIQLSTSRMGWSNDYQHFMPFTNEDIVFDSESSFSNIFHSIKQKGNRDKYIKLLRDIRQRNRKEPMFLVACSLASILVKPCGLLPFIFHLYGEGGKGKTLSSMLAASIWGDPNEDGYIADPKNTATVFEIYLDFLNNMPFICDDMSKLKTAVLGQKKGDFADFIYFLAGGVGKKRSNINLGVNKITHWRNCSITNAERPLTSEVSNGGEFLRVIEMQTEAGLIFDDGQKGKKTADIIRNNFGFIGKEFIEIVQKIGIEKIKEMHEEFAKKITDRDVKNDKEGKQIQPMALIMLADKLLTDYIIKDGVYLDFDTCFKLIRSVKAVSDNERAYEFIINEIRMNVRNFETGTHYEPPQRWGYIHNGYYLINPNIFQKFAEQGNFNKKMFVDWAVIKGLSEVNKGRIDKRFNAKGIKGMYITIKMPDENYFDLEELEGEELEEIYVPD